MMRITVASRVGTVRLAPATFHRQQCDHKLTSNLRSLVRPSLPYGSRLRVNSAAESSSETQYPGMYGPWSITQQDLIEVWTYRICISIVAGTFAAGTALSLFSPDVASSGVTSGLASLGAAALGVALVQIHIYVTPLKRMLQLFWLTGVLGGSYLLVSTGATSISTYVSENPGAVWFVGPIFAALTGLTFKEGVCYGKGEAFALTLLTPALLLSHLSGLGNVGNGAVDHTLVVVVAGLLLVFAGRKYTQPVKDDIGDGSVFNFMKLSPEEQEELVAKLESARGGVSGFDD